MHVSAKEVQMITSRMSSVPPVPVDQHNLLRKILCFFIFLPQFTWSDLFLPISLSSLSLRISRLFVILRLRIFLIPGERDVSWQVYFQVKMRMEKNTWMPSSSFSILGSPSPYQEESSKWNQTELMLKRRQTSLFSKGMFQTFEGILFRCNW